MLYSKCGLPLSGEGKQLAGTVEESVRMDLSKLVGFLRSKEEERQEILEVRHQLMDRLMSPILWFGVLAIFLGALQSSMQGQWVYSLLYLSLYFAVLANTAFKRRLPFRFRSYFLVGAMFFLAIVILSRTGLNGTGMQIMIIGCVLTSGIMGLKMGLISLAAGFVSMSLLAGAIVFGWVPVHSNAILTTFSPLSWCIALVTFSLVAGGLIVIPHRFIDRLKESLEQLEKHSRRLKRSNQILREQIKTRKKTERDLSDAYDIINKSPAVAFLWKNQPGWPVEFVSENVKEIFGYTAEDFMTGKILYSETIFPEDLCRLTEEVMAIGAQETPEKFTHHPYRIVTKDGKVKWVEDRTYVRRDKSGRITHHQGIVEDITERKRAVDELMESHRQFRQIYQTIPDPVILVRARDGYCLEVNDQFVLETGWSREEVIGEGFKNLDVWLHPGDRQNMNEEIRRSGRLDNLEARFRLKNGRSITALLSATSLNMGGERVIVSITRDITERDLAQKALKESEEKYRLVVDNASEWIVIAQGEQILFANRQAIGESGYTLEELSSMRLSDLIHPEDRAEAMRKYASKMKGGAGPGNFEFRILCKSGEIHWVRINSFLVSWMGEPTLLIFMNDISRQKEVEEQKESLQSRLQRAQKMEAIGTLAGGVAHDLNNILSGIVSYPDLLLAQIPDGSPLRKPVMTIKESGKRAAAVVQDLLTLARRGLAVTEPVSLNVLVNDFLESAELERLQSLHPRVRVETRLAKGLKNLSGSPVHLQKTLMNLVLNAFEAMPAGGTVQICTENRRMDQSFNGYDRVREGEYVMLEVSDAGVGISPEDKERIFEPFYTKKTMGRSGTGLGMAVVWGAVKDHQGFIDLESAPGEGTTFTLFFPATPGAQRSYPSVSMDRYMGKGESILVVDDMADQREIATTLLAKLGYSVVAAASGEEALKCVAQKTTDLLVLDMIMEGGMDGLDTYREILNVHPSQRAILASGYSETERVKEAQRLGAGQYIRKPYTIEMIGLAVRKELERSASC
jgi:two-component system, cell cycle sensor histidine kinase and response regulator CckA